MTTEQHVRLDAAAWLERAVAVLALRLRQEVALTRALRGPERQESFLGLFVSDDEAEAILVEVSGRLRASGTAASVVELGALQAELTAERRADPDGVWVRLGDRLGLGEVELDLLVLAAAPAVDPRIGRVYGYLNDDVARRYLTPALAVRLLDQHAVGLADVRRLLSVDSPLRRTGLLTLGPERPAVEAPLRVPEDVLDRLLGQEATSVEVPAGCELLPVAPVGRRVPPGVWLLGRGAPEDVAVDLAAWTGLGLLLVEPADARTGRSPADMVPACLREARLAGALPVLRGFEPDRLVAATLTAPVVVVTDDPVAWEDAGVVPSPLPGVHRGRAERLEALLAGHPANSPELRDWLERLSRLDLLTLARVLRRHGDAGALRAAVGARTARGLESLAQVVTSPHGLDDLVVPPRTRAALRTLIASQDTAVTVRDRWGLGAVFAKSPSTVALFRGPSGTGKTMAAAAVANALELPLVRVNLAGLVSKYIGETEKNLDLLFDAADAADVVLFFDEADAVFGRRSEVHDAHDRYANLETAYLLQRLEVYGGIAVLASNLHHNIDDAFVRRFDLIVDFPPPDLSARRSIWQRLWLGAAPIADDVDTDDLATRFELTGAEIRNACLGAAHIAAGEGTAIDMAALMRAVGRELAKSGRPVRRADFGSHYAALRTEETA